MTSLFGWMDHDDDQRRRMLAAIELFNEDGTVDEIGVGAVRDTISSILFPGASVLHTRARYLLFVPWAAQAAAARGYAAADALRELRRLEVRQIHALKAGGESTGVVGLRAGDKTKRLPSAAYWAVLGRWGIRTTTRSVDGWFRDAAVDLRLMKRRAASEDGDALPPSIPGFHAELPPLPPNTFESTSFTLTAEESEYLSERLKVTTGNSLLPWLLDHDIEGDEVWFHPDIDQAPARLRDTVERGRQFSVLTHGAALLYNLMLAEKIQNEDLSMGYAITLEEWREQVAADGTDAAWDRDSFWFSMRQENPGLKRPTETFVEGWIDRVRAGSDLRTDPVARELVRVREISLKGGRARLANPSALAQWRGSSGLVRLDYNWRVAQRIVGDILKGRG